MTDNTKVFNMDCMEAMRNTPDKFYDLAIVDPPYGINVNMNAGRKKDTRSKKRAVKKWDSETPTAEYFEQLFRVSKNQIIWGANYMTQFLPIKMGWIFWDKCVAPGCSFSDGELAWSSFDMALKKAVIPYSGFIGMEGEKFHPTTKPIKLYEWLLHNYAKQSIRCGHKHTAEYDHLCDICKTPFKILDTHLGSQSSRIAAYKGGYDFTGYEIDADYYNDGNKRFNQFKSQTTLQFQ